MTNSFSTRTIGNLITGIAVLGLMQSVSYADRPTVRQLQRVAGNSNNVERPNCDSPDQPGSQNPGVHLPCSKPYGMTYGEWSAKWWQWVYSIPVETNPQLQGTPISNPLALVDCSVGQSGPVWFLGADFGGTAGRECDAPIPADVSIFFPVTNTYFGVIGFDCIHQGSFARVTYPFLPVNDCLAPAWRYPDLGIPPENQPYVHNWTDLENLVAGWLDGPQAITAEVDGVMVLDLTAYRAKAPMFSVTTPSHNIVGVPWPGISPFGTGVADTYSPNGSDGYWLMLKPLAQGHHTVHFTAGDPPWLDVTYGFTVGLRSGR